MNTPVFSSLCLTGLLTLSFGCSQVNRLYEQDTGEMAEVPGPPPAETSSQYAAEEDVAFIEPMDAGDEDAMLSDDVDAIEPLPEPEPAAPRTYTIQKGDSFWKIAKSVYGDPMRMKDIEAANPDIDPKKLKIGDEIILPE
ncbi:LysM peptidoglycan-binding domain-containing protein [Algisphaera agarilytica]|uniref:Nucleoid-associated protein YgaU n=1 Tax=Algisphaera agarilytica TaxID=1385975 RepID=A0A7X0LMP6_9BACT|nr:LysM domain-containing protein [Algisphaera agarilytica]MBB6431238.1 nucleoid-associated protein YgaU [Algisphaera agarilytica]